MNFPLPPQQQHMYQRSPAFSPPQQRFNVAQPHVPPQPDAYNNNNTNNNPNNYPSHPINNNLPQPSNNHLPGYNPTPASPPYYHNTNNNQHYSQQHQPYNAPYSDVNNNNNNNTNDNTTNIKKNGLKHFISEASALLYDLKLWLRRPSSRTMIIKSLITIVCLVFFFYFCKSFIVPLFDATDHSSSIDTYHGSSIISGVYTSKSTNVMDWLPPALQPIAQEIITSFEDLNRQPYSHHREFKYGNYLLTMDTNAEASHVVVLHKTFKVSINNFVYYEVKKI